MTEDTTPNNGYLLERTGYVAVYEVDNVEFDENGLRFEFMSRHDFR